MTAFYCVIAFYTAINQIEYDLRERERDFQLVRLLISSFDGNASNSDGLQYCMWHELCA